MTSTKSHQSKREVILSAWRHCEADSVGAHELKEIQATVKKTLVMDASPASIARVLADNGVRLRHPEVLQADSSWRECKIHELFGPGELDFETLEKSVESVSRVDDLFLLLDSEGDLEGAKAVAELVRELKNDLAAQGGGLAREVVGWLTVWLQNPQIFSDWLVLRRESAEFQREFGGKDP